MTVKIDCVLSSSASMMCIISGLKGTFDLWKENMTCSQVCNVFFLKEQNLLSVTYP